jgi:hypothetical protein
MSFRSTAAIAALALSSITPAAALAQPPHGSCILSSHGVTSVTPFTPDIRIGRGTERQLWARSFTSKRRPVSLRHGHFTGCEAFRRGAPSRPATRLMTRGYEVGLRGT